MDDCQRHCDKLEEHCVSLMESTCSLERQLQASGKSVKELYVLLERHQSGLKDLIADEARAREFDKCAVHDRFDALDRSHTEVQSLSREFGHHRHGNPPEMTACETRRSSRTASTNASLLLPAEF